MPSADESSAKAKLHEKAETHRRIKKELSKVKSIFVYNGKENKRKKGHRIASILAWAKELGPVSSAVLRQTLADHNTSITYTEFDRILDQLVEEGRITREKQANKTGNTNTRQPYIITFLH
jgi:predicted HTH transcriptional regulator